MIMMRVKWKEFTPTCTLDEMIALGVEVSSKDIETEYEGVVVESARSSFSGWHFLVLLDNGQFRDVLASQCEVVDRESLK